MIPCLGESDWDRYHVGELSPAEAAEVQTHLGSCPVCTAREAAYQADYRHLIEDLQALRAHEGGVVSGRAAASDAASPTGELLPPQDRPQPGSRLRVSVRAEAQHYQSCEEVAAVMLERVGGSIGPYKLLDVLGEGGFGLVYLAEQVEPIRRRVALKVVKLGMDTREVMARFDAERQALAMMDHPHVAKVLDAGTTPLGRPYFVMELVQGIPITDYCDRHRLGARARLDLFLLVCDAAQHAHQKGIIHRDIKPSNVLVGMPGDQPVPKVIDFGVAKAISHRLAAETIYTEQGQFIGTPSYMSPEQAEMTGLNVDTRTDIYSLGVLLYELLAGRLPLEAEVFRSAGYAEIQRIIREEEPLKPSTRLTRLGGASADVALRRRTDPASLIRQLRGDLDWITMKAMEKDRTRRYGTASDLAADIQRHLNHEPVLASPPSAVYRAKKFIRRHRLSVAAGAAVAVALMLGIAGTSWMAVIAARRGAAERHQAELAEQAGQAALRQARIAEAINGFLLDMLSAPDPYTAGDAGDVARNVKVLDLLGMASKKIDDSFASDPDMEAAVRSVLGITYRNLGLTGEAEPHLRRALALRRERLGEEDPLTLESLYHFGILLLAQGQLQEAEPLYEQCLTIRRRVLGSDHPDTLKSLIGMVTIRGETGRWNEAEAYAREALDVARRVFGETHPSTMTAINNLGAILQVQDRLDEAEKCYREAWRLRQDTLGINHPHTLSSMSNIGNLLYARRQHAEAEKYYRSALEGYRQTLGNDHIETLRAVNDLGNALYALGRYAEAESHYRLAVSGCRRELGEDHPVSLKSMQNMGIVLHAQDQLSEAAQYLRTVFQTRRRTLGAQHPDTLDTMSRLGGVLLDCGQPSEAEPLLAEAIRAALALWGPSDRRMLAFRTQHGAALTGMGRFVEAESELLEAYSGLEKSVGRSHRHTIQAAETLTELYSAWQRPNEASQWRMRCAASTGAKPIVEGWGRLLEQLCTSRPTPPSGTTTTRLADE